MNQNVISILLIILSINLNAQSNLETKIDSILDLNNVKELNPGVIISIVRDNKILVNKQRGLANLEYDVPLDDLTVFGVASITKQFTAACIGILSNEGKLDVNDDVRKYIPELNFYSDTIKIKHLLNHTSGIRNHNVLLDLMGYDLNTNGYTNEIIEELMFKQKGVNNKPGAKVLYSNTNYVLLALIVKRVSKNDLATFAKSKIFNPLGMKNTFYRVNKSKIVKNRAYSYYKVGTGYEKALSLNTCVGAGGLVTNVSDMAKWSLVYTDKKNPLYFLKDFLTVIEDSLVSESCARGVFVSNYKSRRCISHGGRDKGMRSHLVVLPEESLSILVYTNTGGFNAENISYQITDLFIKETDVNEVIERGKKDYGIKDLKRFVGLYQELNSDLKMEIKLQNDTLFSKSSFSNQWTAIMRVGQQKFNRLNNENVSFNFSNNELNLSVSFSGAKFYFEKIELFEEDKIELKDYVGVFYSEELDITYNLSQIENKLVLSYKNNDSLILKSGRKDEFGSGRRTLYTFKRNKEGKIIGFDVASEGTVKGVDFVLVK